MILSDTNVLICAASHRSPLNGAWRTTYLLQGDSMASRLTELLEKVTDEKSFNQFLSALREDCESHERDCQSRSYWDCVAGEHWETRSTASFLRSVEDWATGGDFAEGVHHGEPILRRVATMLYVGRHLRPEERPY